MNIRVRDILALLDGIAPFEQAEAWDNSGLLAGHPDRVVECVLIALDLKESVLEEAKCVGAQLILTHHPIMFRGRKNLRTDDAEGRLLCALASSGIALIAMHTNLDKATPGVNDALARRLGLADVYVAEEYLRIGTLPEITLAGFAKHVETQLGDVVRVYGEPDRPIRTVGVLGGSGADFAARALAEGADAFVTGEISYHRACDLAADGLCVLEAGHGPTERPVISLLADALQQACNAVEYKLRIICSTVG